MRRPPYDVECADTSWTRRVYAACGFEHVTWVQLYYENTGLTEFELMEHVL